MARTPFAISPPETDSPKSVSDKLLQHISKRRKLDKTYHNKLPSEDFPNPSCGFSITAVSGSIQNTSAAIAIDLRQQDCEAAFDSANSIANFICDEELLAHIFAFAGPIDAASCSQVCRAWWSASKSHPQLWRTFVQQDYQFRIPKHAPLVEVKKQVDDTSCCTDITFGDIDIDCSRVYAYLATQQRKEASRLDGKVVFADDGGNFGGRYPASNVIRPEENLVWCTNTGVETNVDLVVDLGKPCLITGFLAANGGRGYSAPLKEAIVFASMDPPDLEMAQEYNDANGSLWVKKLLSSRKTRKHREPQQQQQQQHPDRIETTDNTTDSNDSSNNNRQQADNPVQQNKQQPKREQQRHPVAAFEFPNLQTAYTDRSEYVLDNPFVGRYVHFKLLNSFSPPGFEHLSDNIDVRHLHTFGGG